MQRNSPNRSTSCRFDPKSANGCQRPTLLQAWDLATANGGALRPPRNLLLRSLPIQDFKRILPLLERVSLTPRRVLQHDRTPVEQLYFIEEGVVSVLAGVAERRAVEVGMIGPEGVVGIPAVLGPRVSPYRSLVQLGGNAYRINANHIKRAIDEMPSFRTALLHFLHAVLIQASQCAACNLCHQAMQRLARWLLMSQDRSGRAELPITHDALARLLGVRRSTISEAIELLERRGVLVKARGLIRIRDRDHLERVSCKCYRIIRLEQERLLTSPAARDQSLFLPGDSGRPEFLATRPMLGSTVRSGEAALVA
jgi:CRP-like cAMP-binding protein